MSYIVRSKKGLVSIEKEKQVESERKMEFFVEGPCDEERAGAAIE